MATGRHSAHQGEGCANTGDHAFSAMETTDKSGFCQLRSVECSPSDPVLADSGTVKVAVVTFTRHRSAHVRIGSRVEKDRFLQSMQWLTVVADRIIRRQNGCGMIGWLSWRQCRKRRGCAGMSERWLRSTEWVGGVNVGRRSGRGQSGGRAIGDWKSRSCKRNNTCQSWCFSSGPQASPKAYAQILAVAPSSPRQPLTSQCRRRASLRENLFVSYEDRD